MIFLTIKTHFLVAKLLIFFEISNFRKFYASTPYKHIRLRNTPFCPISAGSGAFFLIPGAFHPKPTNQYVILQKQRQNCTCI